MTPAPTSRSFIRLPTPDDEYTDRESEGDLSSTVPLNSNPVQRTISPPARRRDRHHKKPPNGIIATNRGASGLFDLKNSLLNEKRKLQQDFRSLQDETKALLHQSKILEIRVKREAEACHAALEQINKFVDPKTMATALRAMADSLDRQPDDDGDDNNDGGPEFPGDYSRSSQQDQDRNKRNDRNEPSNHPAFDRPPSSPLKRRREEDNDSEDEREVERSVDLPFSPPSPPKRQRRDSPEDAGSRFFSSESSSSRSGSYTSDTSERSMGGSDRGISPKMTEEEILARLDDETMNPFSPEFDGAFRRPAMPIRQQGDGKRPISAVGPGGRVYDVEFSDTASLSYSSPRTGSSKLRSPVQYFLDDGEVTAEASMELVLRERTAALRRDFRHIHADEYGNVIETDDNPDNDEDTWDL